MSVNECEFRICIRFKVEKFNGEGASDGSPWYIIVCESVVVQSVVRKSESDVGGGLNNSENDL